MDDTISNESPTGESSSSQMLQAPQLIHFGQLVQAFVPKVVVRGVVRGEWPLSVGLFGALRHHPLRLRFGAVCGSRYLTFQRLG